MHVEINNDASILQLMATGKCNMSCSFCKHADYMLSKDATIETMMDETKRLVQNTPNLKSVVWGGGEPTLALPKLKRLYTMIKEQKPELSNHLLSNGRKLKLKDVDYINESFNKTTVSIDGYDKGERRLMGFVESNSYEAFETMAKINELHVWSVMTSQQLWDPRWYEDIIKLHNGIVHLGIRTFGLLFDKLMEKPLFTDQVINFTYGYMQIRENMARLQAEYDSVLTMPSFFDSYNCTKCTEAVLIDHEAVTHTSVDVQQVTDSGCNKLAKTIGVENYNYINRFLNQKLENSNV